MVEIERETRIYASRHPYEFVRVKYPERQRKIGYRVKVIEQPDPMLAVMLGDFVHNLRSALDHIIVASVPPKRRKVAGFPILFEDIWARDSYGNLVFQDAERRQTEVQSMLTGLHPTARAFVIGAQPYHLGDNAHRWPVGLISRLENADKHRRLITVGGGIRKPMITWKLKGETETRPYNLSSEGYLKEGTIIGWEWDEGGSPFLSPSEVEMECRGAAEVMIQITDMRTNQPVYFALYPTMLGTIKDVRRFLRILEPFVIR